MMTPSDSIASEPPASEAPESKSEIFQKYLAKLKELPTPEEKIALGLEYMKNAISQQEGTPQFREFWEIRRDVLLLFKQNINSAIRSKLWGDYVELTIEARKLKDILEEQSSFAMEQIDLAITALEQEITRLPEIVAQASAIAWPEEASSVRENGSFYNQIQRELNVLNASASRLNSLRKEIIKTEMRIRYKTKFFKRMSDLGDHIFPRRKELIEQVGAAFEKDVEQFAHDHFKENEVVGSTYYALKDEIKALQSMAKLLTLNTSVFTKTRLLLSECWDKIKVVEKAHRQEFQQKKQVWIDSRALLDPKLEELKKQVEGVDLKTCDAAIDEFVKTMRSLEMSKEDVRHFRGELNQIRSAILTVEEQKRNALEQAEREKSQKKKEQLNTIKEKLTLLQKDTEKTSDELNYEFEQIRRELDEISIGKFELQQFERLFRPLKDLIQDRKESAILNLSDEKRNDLEQLREVLDQRKQRRQEIKDQLEAYRKMLGGSNLDFEKAMNVREQIELEKERLEKINAGILEIDQKISEIEDQA